MANRNWRAAIGLGGSVAPVIGDASAASANVAAIQAALTAGGLVEVLGRGTVYINNTLTIGSNTTLKLAEGITLRQASSTNKNMLVTAGYLRAFQTVTSVTWSALTPLLLTVNLSSPIAGLAQGDALAVKGTIGTTDPAFTGIFPVIDVSTPTSPVVVLRRMPAASPSGTIQAKLCDKNITISGGTWDYNVAQNGSPAAPLDTMLMILGFIYGLSVHDIIGMNGSKYIMEVGAVANYDIRNISGQSTQSDIAKIKGPAFDGVVDYVWGDAGDDALSLQTQEPSSFVQYTWTGGEIINATLSRVFAARSVGVGIYATHGWWRMDSIVVDGVNMLCQNWSGTANNAVKVAGPDSGDTYDTASIGDLSIRNVEQRQLVSSAVVAVVGPKINISMLVIERIRSPLNPGTTLGGAITVNQTDGTIDHLIIRDCQFPVTGTAQLNIIGLGTTNFRQVEVDNINLIGAIGTTVTLVNHTGTFLQQLTISNSRLVGITNVYRATNTSGNTPQVSVLGCWIDGYCVCNLARNHTLYFANNNLGSGVVFGLARSAATLTATLASGGGNVFDAAAPLFTVGLGSPTFKVRGNCADFSVDLSASGFARSPDAIVYNTNAALGTLGVAGLVVSDHAAAGAGSWHLMTDPTKVY